MPRAMFYGISEQWMQELVRDTAVEPEMQQLVQLIQPGWSNARCKVPMQFRPYFDIRDELVVANEIVLRGSRCKVPRCLREEIVKRLHRCDRNIEEGKRSAGLEWTDSFVILYYTVKHVEQ